MEHDLMSTQLLLQQLEQQLLTLAARAGKLDQQLPDWQQRDYFATQLFQTRSRHLLDYVQESMQLCQRIKSYEGKPQVMQSQQLLCEKLAAQVQALMRAFASQDVRQKEQAPKWRTKAGKTPASTSSRHQAGQLLAQLGGTAQAMHQQLAEYRGFERRLQDMVQESAQQQQPPAVQLALHARLGRCRKAISALEAEIQWYEQRGRKS
jgi:primosomal replication protein N''